MADRAADAVHQQQAAGRRLIAAWIVIVAVITAFAAGAFVVWDRGGRSVAAAPDPVRDLEPAATISYMADVGSIRDALANQITNVTGLRSMAQARDQISPPVAVILPGSPLVRYGDTFEGALTVNLRVLLCISDAAPSEKVQRAIDAYLGIGSGTTVSSIPAALMADPTLAGAVQWAIPVQISSYGRIEYAGETYFGGRLDVQIGAL